MDFNGWHLAANDVLNLRCEQQPQKSGIGNRSWGISGGLWPLANNLRSQFGSWAMTDCFNAKSQQLYIICIAIIGPSYRQFHSQPHGHDWNTMSCSAGGRVHWKCSEGMKNTDPDWIVWSFPWPSLLVARSIIDHLNIDIFYPHSNLPLILSIFLYKNKK